MQSWSVKGNSNILACECYGKNHHQTGGAREGCRGDGNHVDGRSGLNEERLKKGEKTLLELSGTS